MTHIDKHIQSIVKKISELKSFDEKINTIASYTKIITGARRCSIFIFNKEKAQLISIYSDGIKEGIILKSDIGLAGYAFHKNRSVLENDAANNPMLYKSVDKKSNFTTRSILTIPIIDKDKNKLGIIQLLNKKMNFTTSDQNNIESLIPVISSLLLSKNLIVTDEIPKKLSQPEILQKEFTKYLEDKHLYLMEDGYAYYKVLNMKRVYFIGANSCYQLTDKSTPIDLYYYTSNEMEEEFLSFQISAMLDQEKAQILISETGSKEKFIYYPFEKEL